MKFITILLIVTIIKYSVSKLINSRKIKVNTMSEEYIPIIGMIAHPYPMDKDENTVTESQITHINAKYSVIMGLRVLPLFWDYTDEELDYIIPKLNGIYIQGNDRNITKIDKFEIQLEKIISKCNKAKIPIWAVCYGLQYMHYYFSKDFKVSDTRVDGYGHFFKAESIEKSSKSFSKFDDNDINLIKNSKSMFHHHFFAVSPKEYDKNKDLKENLIITSTVKDSKGVEMVNTAESKNFEKHKIFLSQFHPEEARQGHYYPQKGSQEKYRQDSIKIGDKVFQAFVDEVKKTTNTNKLNKDDLIKYQVYLDEEKIPTKNYKGLILYNKHVLNKLNG